MKNVLILNRGEIALRAIKTCKRFSLKSFCVINDCEKETLVAKEADKLISFHDNLNPYMSLEIIENLVLTHKIDLLYPGYGFLSEDPRLSELCEKLKVKFIGPSPRALELLSSKKESFLFARDCKLQTLNVENPKISDFPLMIKASFGGGGRGNVICHSIEEFNSSVASLKKRAMALFLNEDYLLERYLPNARHVELQFVATANKVHFLSTRDCSIQLKFQKFLEEGPSDEASCSFIKAHYPSIEKALHKLKYEGVGTIEFLWDGECAYFMEINTRIQVEHPITELLYGIDLVDIQFLIALDSHIHFSFERKKEIGHAICARIYAVDTQNDFRPAPGLIDHLKISKMLRFDTHYIEGNSIPFQFDPLIGKLIVSGIDREECLKNLLQALCKISVSCVSSNVTFITKVLLSEKFKANTHDVSFIEKEFVDSFSLDDCKLSEEELEYIWKHNEEFAQENLDTRVIKNRIVDICRMDDEFFVYRRDFAYMQKVSLNPPFWSELINEKSNITHSPITGRVVSVRISAGESVKKGSLLMVLEAMKTELKIIAQEDILVRNVLVREGSLVKRDQLLIEL